MEIKDNAKLNIGFFSDVFYPYVDGVVSVVNGLANYLDKIGKVYVFCPRPRDKKYKYNKHYEIINCKSIKIPILGMDYPRPKKDKAFLNKIANLDLDIIHIHSPFAMGAFGLELAKQKNIPIVATLHSQFKKDFKRFAKLNSIVKILMKKIMAIFNGADEVWTFNSGCKKTLYEYGFKGKCRLVSNATEMTPILNLEEKIKSVNEEYGLTNTEHIFIFVGRLYKAKNNGMTIKALSVLKQRGVTNFKFVIVGKGEDYRNLKKLVTKYELEKNVVFTGIIHDRIKLAALLERSDLFLFPSLYDMSSIVQIEAACYKTPVVFLKGANTASEITHEVNGFISNNNITDYVNTIKAAISDKEKLQKVGEQAHKDLYVTWSQLADKVYAEYLEIIKAKI